MIREHHRKDLWAESGRLKAVLHVGCGPVGQHRLHAVFRKASMWKEIRLDLDPAVKPDIQCSLSDMSRHVGSAQFDAVWSSHNIEHLADHEVPRAFAEVLRVLRPDGYFLIRCPDILAVVEQIAAHGLECVAYDSPAGPITPIDMLYGHRPSIARGNDFMVHRTCFSDLRLGRMLLEAGFGSVHTRRAPGFDLWAVAMGPRADQNAILDELERHGLPFRQ